MEGRGGGNPETHWLWCLVPTESRAPANARFIKGNLAKWKLSWPVSPARCPQGQPSDSQVVGDQGKRVSQGDGQRHWEIFYLLLTQNDTDSCQRMTLCVSTHRQGALPVEPALSR